MNNDTKELIASPYQAGDLITCWDVASILRQPVSVILRWRDYRFAGGMPILYPDAGVPAPSKNNPNDYHGLYWRPRIEKFKACVDKDTLIKWFRLDRKIKVHPIAQISFFDFVDNSKLQGSRTLATAERKYGAFEEQYSIEEAADILGLEEEILVRMKSESEFTINGAKLAPTYYVRRCIMDAPNMPDTAFWVYEKPDVEKFAEQADIEYDRAVKSIEVSDLKILPKDFYITPEQVQAQTTGLTKLEIQSTMEMDKTSSTQIQSAENLEMTPLTESAQSTLIIPDLSNINSDIRTNPDFHNVTGDDTNENSVPPDCASTQTSQQESTEKYIDILRPPITQSDVEAIKSLPKAEIDALKQSINGFDFRLVLPLDRQNRGVVCPYCGNGTGHTGDGVQPQSKDNKLVYHCFACGRFSGDVIAIIADANNLNTKSKTDFLRVLAIGKKLLEQAPYEGELPEIKSKPDYSALDLEKIRADIIHAQDELCNLPVEDSRGLTVDTLKHFQCGYLAQWTHPLSTSKHVSRRLIIPTGENSYNAILPKSDRRTEADKKFKALNVGSKEIFNDSAICAGEDSIFIVEGEIDAMSIWQATGGTVRIIALGGAAMENSLLRLLNDKFTTPQERLTISFVVAFDNDSTGLMRGKDLSLKLIESGYPATTQWFSYSTEKTDANDILTTQGEETLKVRVEEMLQAAQIELDAARERIQRKSEVIDLSNPENFKYFSTGDDDEESEDNVIDLSNPEKFKYISTGDPTLQAANLKVRKKFVEARINYEVEKGLPLWLYKSYWYKSYSLIVEITTSESKPFYAIDRLNLGEFISLIYENITMYIKAGLTREKLFEETNAIEQLPSFVESVALANIFRIDETTLIELKNAAEKVLGAKSFKEWISAVNKAKFQILKTLNENVMTYILEQQKLDEELLRKLSTTKCIVDGVKVYDMSESGMAQKFTSFFGRNIRYNDTLGEFYLYNENLYSDAGRDKFFISGDYGILQLFQPRWRSITPKKEFSCIHPYFETFINQSIQYCENILRGKKDNYADMVKEIWEAHKDLIIKQEIHNKEFVESLPKFTYDSDEDDEDEKLSVEELAFKHFKMSGLEDFKYNMTKQEYSNYANLLTDMDAYQETVEEYSKWKSPRKASSVITFAVNYMRTWNENAANANPSLIGVLNGVVDLRTGKLITDSRELVTKRVNVPYYPNFRADSIENFFKSTFPNEETRAAVLRWLGYCLTGEVDEQKALFFVGGGSNGKSTLLGLLLNLFGCKSEGYAARVSANLLLMKKFENDANSASPEIEKLRGRRISIIDETKGLPFDEAKFQELTGGIPLTGRDLYKSSVTFDPSHKLIIAGNALPTTSLNLDVTFEDFTKYNPIGRRMAIVPFKQKFSHDNRKNNLLNELTKPVPLAGLFSLLVDEAREWYKAHDTGKSGLLDSAEMDDALKDYYEDCIQATSEKSRSKVNDETGGLVDEIIEFANNFCTITGNSADYISFKDFKARFEKDFMFDFDNRFFTRALRQFIDTFPSLETKRAGSGYIIRGIKFSQS